MLAITQMGKEDTMSTAATRGIEYSGEDRLLVALELGDKKWKLAMATGFGDRPRERMVDAGERGQVMGQLAAAKKHFALEADAPVVSCYEAGREGFWLHRFLEAQGIDNQVVDSSSIKVDRRQRRAKTDRLDAAALLRQLMHWVMGDEDTWSVVRVPSVRDEDARCLHRELEVLKKERTRCTNRIRNLLLTQGVRKVPSISKAFLGWLEKVRKWDGSAVPVGLRARLQREYERMQLVREQIRNLEAQRREAIQEAEGKAFEKVRKMMQVRSIGEGSSWLFTMELFAWRSFENRRQVGAVAGLVPTPYQSGEASKELGIGKAGNRRVRTMAVQIAWSWLRYQPDSELTQWYLRRFGAGGPRAHKIGIVALARKILILLWRWVEFDELPEGVALKA